MADLASRLFDFSGKTVLVTGGSRGLGYEMVKAFAEQGADIIIVSRKLDACEEVAEEVRKLGRKALALSAHCGKWEEIDPMIEKAYEAFGKVDILVNNAGITRDNLAMRMKDDEWDQVIRINLEASFRLMRASARPMMKAKGGRIISITSVVGHTGNPGQMNYVAAKAGLTGMSKSLAQELASRNITVNCVAPGFIRTAMTDALNDEQKAAINGRIPMGRMGEGDEIGAAVAYLASDEAAYVTGQTLHVNGGMAMMG